MCRVLFSLVLTLVSASVHGQISSDKVDAIVHRYDSLGGFNGVIVIGLKTGKSEIYTYGYKDPVTKKEPITRQDRFDIASLTKQFTGLAILQLISENKLHPDDPIGPYFPELHANLGKVTVRQLANHTNGIHDYFALTPDHENLTNAHVLSMLGQLDTTVFTPGSKWGYSNSGYVLLSQLVERVTGISFENYLTSRVLEPVGIRDFQYAPRPVGVLNGFTSDHLPALPNSFNSGAAGLYLSAEDFIRYHLTVSTDDNYWSDLLLQSRTLSDTSNEEGWNYGFGWYFNSDESGNFRAHSGKNPGCYNYLRWYEHGGPFICILSNKSDSFIRDLREDILDLVKVETKK